MNRLEQIRNQISNSANGIKPPDCPKCGHSLTVEKTEYFETELCENCFDHAVVKHLESCCKYMDLQYVKLITAAGTIQVRQQCKSCGTVKPNSLGGFTKEQRENFPLVDEVLRKSKESLYRQNIQAFYSEVSVKRKLQLEGKRVEKMALYAEYLNTEEWKIKRNLVLKRDNYLCQCCLDSFATQVHHKSYEFVDLRGSEPAFDLVAICTPCHDRIEKMKREGRS